MIVSDLGLLEYGKALSIQENTRDKISDYESFDTLLVCEHPQVITVGRGLGSYDEIFVRDVPIFEVSRGGRSTLHLPGQCVVYPIIDLRKRSKDLHGYIRLLESAIISTLQDFRIPATRLEGRTGVWVSNHGLQRKIASIGIAVKKWVTYHGIAVNITCDLKSFSKLSPCGFSADIMTSVEKELNLTYKKVWGLDRATLFKKVKMRLVENIQSVLEGHDSEFDLDRQEGQEDDFA